MIIQSAPCFPNHTPTQKVFNRLRSHYLTVELSHEWNHDKGGALAFLCHVAHHHRAQEMLGELLNCK
jgi:hypothetical protein